MISTKEYLKLVEKSCIVPIIENEEYDSVDLEVIQVWFCKTIMNHKGLFIVRDIKNDNILPYFIEATYNGNTQELYLDFYTKDFKYTIKCE